MGYSAWVHKELNATKQQISLSYFCPCPIPFVIFKAIRYKGKTRKNVEFNSKCTHTKYLFLDVIHLTKYTLLNIYLMKNTFRSQYNH